MPVADRYRYSSNKFALPNSSMRIMSFFRRVIYLKEDIQNGYYFAWKQAYKNDRNIKLYH